MCKKGRPLKTLLPLGAISLKNFCDGLGGLGLGDGEGTGGGSTGLSIMIGAGRIEGGFTGREGKGGCFCAASTLSAPAGGRGDLDRSRRSCLRAAFTRSNPAFLDVERPGIEGRTLAVGPYAFSANPLHDLR